LTLKLLLQNAD